MIRPINNNPTVKINPCTTGKTVKVENVTKERITEEQKYNGKYEIIPDVIDQELQTQEKYLKKNVTVKSVPIYEVKNAAGGDTVIIGG